VTSETRLVEIVFGEDNDGLSREVEVVHHRFPNGGEWSLFLCPVVAVLRAFSSCTRSRCVGAAAFAMGLDIAYRAAHPSSATSRG
jgi:hypothetical protein